MAEEMKNHTTLNEKNTDTTLFFGVNKNGEIVQFDKKCQNLTGYHRDEVLNQKIWDYLIPEAHLTEWQHLIEKVLKSETVENLQLPWKTSDGNQIMVTWNSFPIKNDNTGQQNYCFSGQPNKITYQLNQELPEQNNSLLNYENKQTTEIKNEPESYLKNKQEIPSPPDSNQKPKEYPKDTESFKTLQKKYNDLENRLIDLEKKDNTYDDQNIPLDDISTSSKNSESYIKTDNQNNTVFNKSKMSLNIKNLFKSKDNKNVDDTEKLDWIEHKTQELNKKEQQLIQKEKKLDRRLIELGEWKEKLIELESEILKRYDSILTVEKQHNQPNDITPIQQITQESIEEHTQSVAILQRGLFKAINTSLTDTFGFKVEELANRSFYDLIAPEGLAEMEQFHLDRLKGKKTKKYSTVIINKEDEKIPVHIEFDSIVFNEQKADLALIIPKIKKSTEKTNEEKVDKPELSETVPIATNEFSKEKQSDDSTEKENHIENDEKIVSTGETEDQIKNEDSDKKNE